MSTPDSNVIPVAQQSLPSALSSIVQIPGAIYRRRCPENWKDIASWTVEFISDFIADISGYERSSFTTAATLLSQLIEPEDRKRVAAEIERSILLQQPYTVEYRILAKNKDPQWVLDRGQGVWDSTGQLLYLDGVIFDINERKSIEENLQQSEVRFRKLARRETLLNYLSSQIRHSLDIETVLQTVVSEVRQLLQIDRCSFCWYHTTPLCLEFACEDRNPAYPSFLGLYPLDPANPVDANNPLVVSLQTLTLHRVNDVETANNLSAAARQTLERYGYTAELFIPICTQAGRLGGVHCGHHSSSRPWTDDEVALLRAIAGQCAIALDHAELYEQSRQAALAAQEQAQKLQAAMTQLKQTQTQLIQTEKMSSLGQLVAGVAHEINNPVNFIYGNVNHARNYIEDLLTLIGLLQERQVMQDPEIQAKIEEIDLDFITVDLPKLLASMEMGADRIRKIVLSLRSFSRLDEADKKKVDLHEGLDSTLLILQNRLKGTPIKPTINVIKNYGILPKVECYAGQINQVFMNILVNAIDALEQSMGLSHLASGTEPDSGLDFISSTVLSTPTITIQTEAFGDDVYIRIADNGVGMPEAVKARLFDPFFTTKPVGQGTGLGLSISYQIVVEKHGGSLDCASVNGEGTEFCIRIPSEMRSPLS